MTTAKASSPSNIIPRDLLIINEIVFSKKGFEMSELIPEKESAEYAAFNFKLNQLSIKYRIAKTTPTKSGQFVTLWKRSAQGPIQPFDVSDEIDLFIISSRNESHFGQFIFPKSILHKKGVISDDSKEGKRAIRVYPPWDKPTSKQAKKTQEWQSDYFLETPEYGVIDFKRVEKLLKGNPL